MQTGHNSPAVRAQAIALLDRNALAESYNSYYLLANELARRWPELAGDPAAQFTVLNYLKLGLRQWESQSAPEFNIRVFMNLARLDPSSRNQYEARIAQWQLLHWEEEHLKRLPAMALQGQFFLVFEQYFLWMEFWGIETELPPAEFHTAWNSPKEGRMDIVEQWRTRGEIVPAWSLKIGARRVVSSEFLLVGSALFHPPLDSDPKYEVARGKFNAAYNSFQEFLRMIGNLPGIPREFSESLRAHGDRLYKYSKPPEGGRTAASVA
jgi:hypothetical protein